MTADAMRNRLRKAYADEFYRQPLPPLRPTPLSGWRQVLPALEARAQRFAPVADIWLPALLNELDRRLDAPLQVTDEGPVRTIIALDFVCYTIDRQARTVSSTLLVADDPIEVDPTQFDVVSAWQRFGWLVPLLGELQPVRTASTLLPENRYSVLLDRLSKLLTPMLRRDDRFLQLRRQLRQALRFDPALFRLALRARPRIGPESLRGSHLIRVWQHEAALRVIEQDAPELLPLAPRFFLTDLAAAAAPEAVKVMKAQLCKAGLTDAGWRYLLRHGVRRIEELGGGLLSVGEIASLAQALALAGAHAPPTPALCRALAPRFMPIARAGAGHKDSVLRWLKTERRLASAILKAANEMKHRPDYGRFIDAVTAVLWWLRDAKIETPRKALGSLIRAAQAWEEDQLAIARSGRRRWSRARLIPCPDGLHEAVLLDGPVAVLEEARLMRNCLRARLPVMKSRKLLIWSVRNKATGKRVALIELKREKERWSAGEIAGRFNRAVPGWVKAFAETLAACESARNDCTGVNR